MKNLILSALLAFGILSPLSYAQEGIDSTSQQETSANIAATAKKLDSFKGKINSKAKYYAYLFSASWCTPCRAIMPDIVKEYRKMKRAGLEVILICADRGEVAAKDYVKKYRIKFPYVLASDPEVSTLPGFRPARGIPNVIFVDAAGNVITSGHGAMLLKWEDIIKK